MVEHLANSRPAIEPALPVSKVNDHRRVPCDDHCYELYQVKQPLHVGCYLLPLNFRNSNVNSHHTRYLWFLISITTDGLKMGNRRDSPCR